MVSKRSRLEGKRISNLHIDPLCWLRTFTGPLKCPDLHQLRTTLNLDEWLDDDLG
jgi:hypothetical protein